MKVGVRPVVGKLIGTLALAVGFLVLVTRTPFLPETGRAASPSSVAAPESVRLQLPNLRIDPAALPVEAQSMLSALHENGGLQPSLGLFRARFAESETMPGFITEEHRVSGGCEGAGWRHVQDTCPTCTVSAGNGEEGLPAMLLWSDERLAAGTVSAATQDCTAVAPDGAAIVTTFVFDGDSIDLAGPRQELALDLVPLLPGATRLAAFEIGAWLMTSDRIARPSTAVADMAAALRRRGWRDAPGASSESTGRFEGDRVLVNDEGEFCVVSLGAQNGTYHLVTLIAAQG